MQLFKNKDYIKQYTTMTKITKEIVFEPIDFDAQKNQLQFAGKIFNSVNGKNTYADEETGFIFQKFSGFAPKAFIKEDKNRDFVRISLDPEQQSCVLLEQSINSNDDLFEANRKLVFGKFDRLYKFARSVKEPKSTSEETFTDDELDENENEKEKINKEKDTKDTQPKYNSCKMKLKMDWFYYYQGYRLDKINTNIVKKAVSDSMTKNKNLDKDKRKALLNTLTFKLNIKDDNDKIIQKEVKMDELEQKREIDTKIFHRKPTSIPPNAQEFLKKQRGTTDKEIAEYETELINLFGDPGDSKDVRQPDELDSYYKYNCWVRFLYSPFRVWASKTKDDDIKTDDGKVIQGKRKSGIKYIINSIDIIQLPFENNYNASHKIAYSKYAFGKNITNNDLLINQSVDTVFTSVEKTVQLNQSNQVNQVNQSNQPNNIVNKNDLVDKKEKKQMKEDSDSESDSNSDDDSDDSKDSSSESESESESSESEHEPEPVKKGKGKTVLEPTKNTKLKDQKKTK